GSAIAEVSDLHEAPAPRRPETGTREPGAGSIHVADALSSIVDLGAAPSCSFCGSIMTRNGSCYRCMSCGSTSGCSWFVRVGVGLVVWAGVYGALGGEVCSAPRHIDG